MVASFGAVPSMCGPGTVASLRRKNHCQMMQLETRRDSATPELAFAAYENREWYDSESATVGENRTC